MLIAEEFDELLEVYPRASPSCVGDMQAQVLSLFEELLQDPAADSHGPLTPDRCSYTAVGHQDAQQNAGHLACCGRLQVHC